MGASGSINNYVYLSCPNKTDDHVNQLQMKIKDLNGIISPEVSNNDLYNYISQVNYVIVCLFADTIRDRNQIIEINYALELQKKIIFICMDSKYTVSTYPSLRGLIKDNHNINCCSIDCIDMTCEEIKRIVEE